MACLLLKAISVDVLHTLLNGYQSIMASRLAVVSPKCYSFGWTKVSVFIEIVLWTGKVILRYNAFVRKYLIH
jgi:hypothetical protein